VNNYRPISILNTFSEIFEIIIREHVSHHFWSKFNSRHHGVIKSKSTSNNHVVYFYFITPLVHPQFHDDHIYFHFSNSFYLVSHTLLLRKLDDFGLSPTDVTRFHSYLTNRISHVRYRGALPTSYYVLSAVSLGSIPGPLLFIIFINDLCSAVKYSNWLLLADDVKINREKKIPPYDSWFLQSDTNNVRVRCIANYIRLNVKKTGVISLCRKTN